MLGKVLVGAGFLMCSLSARVAGAQTAEGPPVEEEHTVILGFQAVGHAARLQSDTHPDGRKTDWFTVCEAPCTRRVPWDARFRALGIDADPSPPFRLPEDKERVIATTTLEKPRHTAPKMVMAIGYAVALVGLPVAFVGLMTAMTGEDPNAVLLLSSSQQSQSRVSIAQATGPRLALPGGFALESRGLTF